MKLDSLEIPRTFPKTVTTDLPEAGDKILSRYPPLEEDSVPTYDVERRVPVRYIVVVVEDTGIDFGRVIDRIEDVANVLEAEELVK